MTGWGQKLADTPAAELRAHVTVDRQSKPVWRLVAAVEYKDGLSPAEFEAKYGIPADTVYTWLDRFEEQGVAAALYDKPRPGRPPKLGEAAWDRFLDHLRRPPGEFGYEAAAWSTNLARRHLGAEFGVDYSARHVRRLLDRAGVRDDASAVDRRGKPP